MKLLFVFLGFLELITKTEAKCGMTPPTIVSSHAKILYFTEGSSLTLECNGTGSPRLEYTWFKDGAEVKIGSKYRMTNMTLREQGSYLCHVNNNAGVAVSPPTQLIFGYSRRPPVQEPTKHEAVLGQPLEITCNSGISVPQARINWVRKREPVDPSPVAVNMSKRIHYDQEGKLYFTNVLRSDGTPMRYYQCQAYNFVTHTTRGGTLSEIQVRGTSAGPTPPSILIPPPLTVDALVGQPLRITCMFGGNPPPDVLWTRVRGSLPGNHRFLDFNRTLELLNFQETSVGKYLCRGTNTEGYFSFEVTVNAKTAPVWEKKPENQVVQEGKVVMITCKATGKPGVSTKWYMNGMRLDDDNLGQRRTIQADGSLRIVSVQEADIGTYQCNASNSYGYLVGEAYLQVNCLSRSTLPPGPTPECPRGFVMNQQFGSCYKIVPSGPVVNWFQAMQFCQLYQTGIAELYFAVKTWFDLPYLTFLILATNRSLKERVL